MSVTARGAFVSDVNSTTTAVTNSSEFEGTFEDVIGYSSATVNYIADGNSTHSIVIKQSSSISFEDHTETFTYTGGTGGASYDVPIVARYFKIDVTATNDTDAAITRMETIYHVARPGHKVTEGRLNVELYDSDGNAVGVAGGSLEVTLTDSTGIVNALATPVFAQLSDGTSAIGTTTSGNALKVGIITDAGASNAVTAPLHVQLGDGTSAIGTTTAGSALKVGIVTDGGLPNTVSAPLNVQLSDGSSAVTVSGGALSVTSALISDATIMRSLNLGTTGTIEATARNVYRGIFTNQHASLNRYVKIYDKATAATDADIPFTTIVVFPQTTLTVDLDTAIGLGLSARATTGIADNDTGAPSENDVVMSIWWST